MSNAIFCADIGTSSLKTALIDAAGQVLAQSRIAFPKGAASRGTDGSMLPRGLFSAEHWLNALCEAAARLKSACPAARIAGLCVSGNGPTLATDTGEVLLWNAAPNIPTTDIQRQLADTRFSASIFLPRLLLFRAAFPDQWTAAERIFSGPEYLVWRLTGRAVTVLPEERFRSAYWDEAAVEKLGIDGEKLPPFVPLGTSAGTLTPSMAEKLALPAETPVFCGGPDFTVALIGTNTLEPGRLCDRAGSSEGLNLCLDKDPRPAIAAGGIEGVRVLPSVVPSLFNASVLIPDSGTRFSQFKQNAAPRLSYQEFVAALLETPSRNPEGLQLMEELAAEVGGAYETLAAVAQATGTELDSAIRTTGGQAKNPRWLQYKSSRLGLNFATTACADAELTGAAVLGWTALGKFSSIQEGAQNMVRLHHIFEPTSE